MKTVMITGVNGFLGQYAARHFHANGWFVIGVGHRPTSVSLKNACSSFHPCHLPSPQVAKLLHDVAPALCIHCAGSAMVPESFDDPAKDFVSGPDVVFELLNQIRQNSPRTKFLFLSSAAVYGNPKSQPVMEMHELAPASPYGYHKLVCEKICEEFARLFDVHTASLRIFSAYGRGLRRQVIWEICRKAVTEPELVLQGTGFESRDFVHAVDIARAMELALQAAPFAGEAYNLASGHETTIVDLSNRILHHLSIKKRVHFDGIVPRGKPRNWRADMSALQALGFTPNFSLDEGLADVASWFLLEGMDSWRQKSA